MTKIRSIEDAVELISDGDVVGLQGGPTQCAPMAIVRELIRSGRRELWLVCLSAGLPVDWLAAAGCLAGCTFSAVSMERFGLCRRFRATVETGDIVVEELSETALYARLGAGSRGLPFLPTRGMIGTDLLEVSNDHLRLLDDPFGGPPVVACRALTPDVAILHAHRADRRGNVGVDPGVQYPTSTVMPRASHRVIVTVEEVVETDELRRTPQLTILPGFAVDAVVPVRYGAHPTSLFPGYGYDARFFSEWVRAAMDADASLAFLDRYVRDPETHDAYLKRVGGRARLAALERWQDQ